MATHHQGRQQSSCLGNAYGRRFILGVNGSSAFSPTMAPCEYSLVWLGHQGQLCPAMEKELYCFPCGALAIGGDA
eukprot:6347625-Amphidinium_carterae.2